MKIDIDIEDYTIILNALHYYKKVETTSRLQMRINFLRDWPSSSWMAMSDKRKDP